MFKLIVALLALAAIVFAILTYAQLSRFRQSEQERIDQAWQAQPAPGQAKPEPDIQAERQRLLDQGMFWHHLPATIWAVIGGILLLLAVVLALLGRKRDRSTRLEAVTSLSRRE
jgi:hypothetical protein